MMKFWKKLRRQWHIRNADVHIVSFPKCGRTWLVLMLARVMEQHYGVKVDKPLKLRRFRGKAKGVPLILQHHDGGPEFQTVEQLERDKSIYAGKKVLFLVRDPRDVTVSAYFQKTKRNYNYEGALEEYLHEPVGGLEANIAFYNIWARNRHVPSDFLLMTYEDIHADAAHELRRAVEFVGLKGVSDQAIAAAVEACRFDKMRKMEATNALGSKRMAPRDASDESTYKTREGRTGGYRDHFGAADIHAMEDIIDAQLDAAYAFYWTKEKRASSVNQAEKI